MEPENKNDQTNCKKRNPVLIYAYLAYVIVIAIRYIIGLWFPYLDVLGIFFFYIPMFLLYLCLLVISIFYSLIKFRSYKLKALFPLFICIAIVLSLLIIPFQDIQINANFKLYHSKRDSVIQLIEKEQKTDFYGEFILPPDYKNLSYENKVWINCNYEQLDVIFIFSSGVAGEYTGLLYSSNEENCQDAASVFMAKIIRKVAPNWFWITDI